MLPSGNGRLFKEANIPAKKQEKSTKVETGNARLKARSSRRNHARGGNQEKSESPHLPDSKWQLARLGPQGGR